MTEEENKKNHNGQDELEELKNKLKEIEQKKDEYLAGWQRAKADFINYKSEEMARLEEMAKYGNENLIYEFIGVMDNFDLGLEALEKSGPVEKGIYMIRSQIFDILKKRGLEKINIQIGDQFDPGIAEAISEAESEKPPGTIIGIIETGYKLHGRVLRPTRVQISKSQK